MIDLKGTLSEHKYVKSSLVVVFWGLMSFASLFLPAHLSGPIDTPRRVKLCPSYLNMSALLPPLNYTAGVG